jgi:AcrR family transcriptional regulator
MRMPKKSYHREDLRNDILKEARLMIGKEGMAAFSMRDLSRRLGVSHAAAYRHFASKEALLGELIMDANVRFYRCLDDARAGARGDPAERLLAIGRAYLDFGLADRADLELLFGGESMALTRRALAAGRVSLERIGDADSFAILSGTVGECVEAGYFPAGTDPESMGIVFWSLVHGYCALARDGALEGMCSRRGIAEAGIRRAFLGQLRLLVRK